METVLKILGRIGLVLTLVPSLLYFIGLADLGTVKVIMIIGTILWLVAAPLVQRFNKQATVGE